MMEKTTFLTSWCLGVMLLAGAAGLRAENQPPAKNYGSTFTEGLQLENRRDSARRAEIQKEQVDANTQYTNDMIACQSDAACKAGATQKYRGRMAQIEIEQNNESGTHQKNLIDVTQHWQQQDQWGSQGCTMGGGSMPCQDAKCSGACK